MSNFTWYWYDRYDHEFQVECSVSKPRAATRLEPAEPSEIEVLSIQPVVGEQLGACIIHLMDADIYKEISERAECHLPSE